MTTQEIRQTIWDEFADTLESSQVYEPHYGTRREPVPEDQEEEIAMTLGYNDDCAIPPQLHTAYAGFTWRFADRNQPSDYAEVQVMKNFAPTYTGRLPSSPYPGMTPEEINQVELRTNMRDVVYGAAFRSPLRHNELVSTARTLLLRQPGLIVRAALRGELAIAEVPEDLIFNTANLALDLPADNKTVGPTATQLEALTGWMLQRATPVTNL